MKLVYICSPLRGNIKENIKKATVYCAYAAQQGVIPLAPHTIFTQYLDDTIPAQREKGIAMGMELLKRCDELWVCGDTISQGMQKEIDFSIVNNICIKYMSNIDILLDRGLKEHPKLISVSGIKGYGSVEALSSALSSQPTAWSFNIPRFRRNVAAVFYGREYENQMGSEKKLTKEEEIEQLRDNIRDIKQCGPIFLTRTDDGVTTNVILPEEAHELFSTEDLSKVEEYIMKISNKEFAEEPVQEENMGIEMSQ